jgi:hypothetical protein
MYQPEFYCLGTKQLLMTGLYQVKETQTGDVLRNEKQRCLRHPESKFAQKLFQKIKK